MTTIAIKTHDGYFVSAERGGGGKVAAKGLRVGDWETFRLVDRGGNRISLQTYDGHYVCAEQGGGGIVVANRKEVGVWETFQVIYRGVNDVALKTYSGHFLCAEQGKLAANRKEIGERETFAPVYRANLKVQFDSSDFARFQPGSKPHLAWTSSIENESDTEIGHLVSKKASRDASFALTLSETLAAGANAEFPAEVPFIAATKKTVTAELELVAGQSWSKIMPVEYQFTDVVTVPSHGCVEATGVIQCLDNVPIPYVLRFWVSARDMDGTRLNNEELGCLLHQRGFTGSVVDRGQSNKLLVAIGGTMIGNWGTGTGIRSSILQVSEAEAMAG